MKILKMSAEINVRVSDDTAKFFENSPADAYEQFMIYVGDKGLLEIEEIEEADNVIVWE